MANLQVRNGKRFPGVDQAFLDDESDQAEAALADKLAHDGPLPVEDDEPPVLPPQTATGRSDVKPPDKPRIVSSQCVAQPARPQQTNSTINPKEFIEVIVAAYTGVLADRLTIYAEGHDIVVEQFQDGDRGPIKATWRIGIRYMRKSAVRLLK